MWNYSGEILPYRLLFKHFLTQKLALPPRLKVDLLYFSLFNFFKNYFQRLFVRLI